MRVKVLLLLAAFLCLSTMSTAQTGTQPSSDEFSSEQVLGFVRTLGTAQATIKYKTGGYVSLEGLLQHGSLLGKRHGEIVLTDNTSGKVKDYKISVVASADGQHFQVALVPQKGCGYALFINESFIIYEADALECSSRQKQVGRDNK